MLEDLSGRGATVLLIGSLWMALIAAAIAASAIRAVSADEAIYRLLVAGAAVALAVFSFRAALDLRAGDGDSETEAESLVPLPVRVKR